MSSRELAQAGGRHPAQLADVLERVLDKGIVIAGDIQINLLDIELLTVKLRLLVASADKAREMLGESGLAITAATDLTDAARKVVAAAKKANK